MIWVNPLVKIGEVGCGLPAAGLPLSSSRNSLPASDVLLAAPRTEPASPVPT